MKCRFCGTTIRKQDTACPSCGKQNPQPQIPAAYQKMKQTAVAFGFIAALSALAVVLLVAMLSGWDIGRSFRALMPRENDVYYKDSYTVSDRKAAHKRGQVVATMGDLQLTNGQLQVYYWMQVRDFAENYGSTTAALTLDYSQDFANQRYTDSVTTWQQFFLESALEMWQTNQAFAALAAEAGYTLPAERQQYLDTLPAELEQAAAKNGYADAQAMLQNELGAGVCVADYVSYLRVYYTGYLYFRQLYDQIQPTDAEIQKYYEENLSDFTQAGITETAGNYVDVRHILIPVRANTAEGWDACRQEAEAVLTQWESGGLTESEFILLAATHSQDEGTASRGGLLLDLTRGDMEDSFGDWCFAPERQAGDYGLVKTSYGYHIVYFVNTEAVWHAEARTALIQTMGRELVEQTLGNYVLDVNYKKIVLTQGKIG